LRWDSDIPVVNASHWYDLLTLITKRYDPAAALVWGNLAPVKGDQAVRESFKRQIGAHLEMSREHLNDAPTLIGEFGIPYDLNDGRAFTTGDFSEQEAALGSYYDALDAHLSHSAQWNYTADNSNRWGDGWNQEDLSLFSADQLGRKDPDAGARALKGFCRPCVQAAAGIPRRQEFALDRRSFTLEVENDPRIKAPTEVFIPLVHFPVEHTKVEVSSGSVTYDVEKQTLEWRGAQSGMQVLKVFRC
jgi:hypothetical protein